MYHLPSSFIALAGMAFGGRPGLGRGRSHGWENMESTSRDKQRMVEAHIMTYYFYAAIRTFHNMSVASVLCTDA